jgi:hypothetical protein
VSNKESGDHHCPGQARLSLHLLARDKFCSNFIQNRGKKEQGKEETWKIKKK